MKKKLDADYLVLKRCTKALLQSSSQKMLKANLELTGRYEARVEPQAENAVKVAHEFKPDLFLLDARARSRRGRTTRLRP